MKTLSDLRVVATSFLVSISDVVLNFTVAFFTGSTVMLSQGLQGLSDLITGGILFLGVKRSKKKSDDEFQFGYGREIFFWVLIAGIIMFIGTGTLSVVLGYGQLVDPEPVENILLAFAMLVFGASTNGYAFTLSLKRLRQQGGGKSWFRHFIGSSIIETKATFIIDLLGTSAAILGLVALSLYAITGNAQFDGLGSMAIGFSMMGCALFLMRDVRDLIVGKSVDKETSAQIIEAAKKISAVQDVLDLRTMYLGSAKLLVVIEVHIDDDHTTDSIEKITDEIKHSIQQLVPLVHHVQVEIETPDAT